MSLPAYRVAKTLSGNSPPTFDYIAGGTVVKDQFVVLADDGNVEAAPDDAIELHGLATNGGVAGEEIRVILNTADVVFSANVEGGTFTEDMRGSHFDMKIIGIALDETGALALQVEDEDTTDPGRVLITVPSFISTAPGGTHAAPA